MIRQGRYVLSTQNDISVISTSSVVGHTEGQGPLKDDFDCIFDNDGFNQSTWEQAESELHKKAVELAIFKAGLKSTDIDIHFAGDLLNQCSASNFAELKTGIPFAGVYGACSTMALSLALATVFTDCGGANTAIASTSSHFCSAEKQFRFPLEYGGQRPPTSQRTATASGAMLLQNNKNGKIYPSKVMFGKIVDLGVTDSANMGAAMAPAAAFTIGNFLKDTQTAPKDYDLILTGDLGYIGSELMLDLLKNDYNTDISSVHNDCGKMMYYRQKQDVHAGGSGCGCSAAILCSHIYKRMMNGELKKVLFAATGALMSPLTSQQGLTVPGISHAVLLESR